MPKGSRKKSKREDEVQAAVRIMNTIAEKAETEPVITDEIRRRVAADFGRIGGKIGGVRRAEKLTDARKKEIAKKAAAARWSKRQP
jgi:hypothetical protein